MRSAILFYLAGVALSLLNPDPPRGMLGAPLFAAALAGCAYWRAGRAALFVIGLAWGGANTAAFLSARPQIDDPGIATMVSGAVRSFAQARDGTWSFDLEPAPRSTTARLARVRYAIHGYDGARPAPDAWCVVYARLRRPHGLANPGARDRERSLAARHIAAVGRVVRHPANLCLDIRAPYGLAAWRTRLAERIDAAVVSMPSAAVLRALTVADRSGIVEAQWTVFRSTGTAHLLAISGLHITLAAALAFGIGRYLAASIGWRRQGYPAIRAAWIASTAGALLYAGLAGFGVPAVRAGCMVAVATLAALSGRRVLSWDSVLLALALITTLDPFALLSESLWLSFSAVGILVALAQRQATSGGALAKAWRMHVALALGMAPLTGAVFGEIPLIAPLANLIAVPWCSVLVVPLTLSAAVTSLVAAAPAAILWDMAARLLLVLTAVLEWLAALDWRVSAVALAGDGGLAPAAYALVLLALPRGLYLRPLAGLLLVSLLLARAPGPSPGTFSVTVLDVGQGLAVLVRTARHTLLYDTGPRWWSGADAGTHVVVPALARAGIGHVDRLVISHTDTDHVGGLAAVLAAVTVGELRAPLGADLGVPGPARACDIAETWIWDDVRFRLLASGVHAGASRNDRSCVLLIESPRGRLLLTGDIERKAETALVARYGRALRAEVMVVPHHGSATSSSPTFVAAVGPRYAIIPAGYANRYRLPHADVLARYHSAGVSVLNTAETGAVSIAWADAGPTLRGERSRRHGFWQSRARESAPACATFGC
jgi:competence protein ComEC